MTMTAWPPLATAVGGVDPQLRASLLRCWTDVSNAGGCVGFVPPVATEDVAPVLDAVLTRVRSGVDTLVVVREGSAPAEPAGELLAFAVLSPSPSTLREHLGTVQRVQVRPEHQGRGLGTVLMSGVHDAARRRGLELLHLTVRGGSGREAFYQRLGYQEFGRLPGGVRLGATDYRDEIHLYTRL